ncbi:hypothetical protein ASG04_06330 [Curtobacterium sp. Leaf183]|uniref:cell division protein PerM n=1 Tax=Curtobacterium sp. Leaf183 TaxID=1736291 RepID=UPI0006FDB680|nr:DUF6350 family protein [Curtobacterium sp. Leaf183]KQS10183.1 hypothetical protein ASG04_06330 [Curtobacterium sp. Leaf183]
MNRLGTALLAAIEAVVTVGVGLGIALVPLTLLWGFEYGLQVDWDVFWKAAGSVWLIGHGVDVTFVLGAAAAKASGVSGAGDPIAITLAALGFAAVTAWLGARAGRRFAETEHRVTGILVGTAVAAVLGLGVGLSSTSAATHPALWQAVVFPALWFGVPALAAAEVCRRRRSMPADPVTGRVLDQLHRVPEVWRTVAGFGLRAGTAATAAVVAVAGIVVGFLLFGSFAEVITLYERSHAEIVGGVALTVGQLAFLPDFIGWATSWLVGPGFAIGTGSTVSPIGTALGPIPALPVFGALPASGHTFGLLWVLVPVLAGFAAGGLLRPRLVRALGADDSALLRAAAGLATGIVAGLLTGGIAWLSSGSFGPGRLADVGPHALVVGLFAALEVGVPAIVALAIGQDLVRMPERPWAREHWHEADDDARDDAEVHAEGSLLDALDRAGAGRTTDVHRFAVSEAHHAATRAGDHGTDSAVTEPVEDDARRMSDAPRSSRSDPDHRPDRDPDHDVPLPDWARSGAPTSTPAAPRAQPSTPEPSAGPGGRVGAVRDRLRGAADGVKGRAGDLRGHADGLRGRTDGLRGRAAALRSRAGSLRDRVTGADAERADTAPDDRPDLHRPERPEVAGARDEQRAFPWSTEEFVSGRDDADEPTPPPAAPGRWDTTDQVPEDELPWWRRPKDDR